MVSKEELLWKQQETSEEILDLVNKIPSKKMLYFFGGLFQKGDTKENFIFWLFNYIFLTLSVMGPALLVSIALHELNAWKEVWVLWAFGLETSVLAIMASYLVTKMILKDIANNVVEKINNIDDLNTLRNNLTESFLPRNILPYSISAWLAWDIAVIPGISYFIDGFVGWGPSIATVSSGILVGISFHYLVWSSQIPIHLQNLEYELNNFIPANSELINRLTGMLNKYLYFLAFAFAIFTLETSLVRGLVVLSFFPVIGWITITTQFLINRLTIKKIVDKARWKTLNQIQAQMNKMQMTDNLSEKETADALVRLADLHQRVFANSTSSLDFRTALSFFSQLMLPLLGLLLGNLDNILDLLQK